LLVLPIFAISDCAERLACGRSGHNAAREIKSDRLLGSRQRRPESEVFNERIEVAVAVQQGEAAFDTTRGNHSIDRLPHSNAQCTERAKVLCRLNGYLFAAQIYDDQGHQQISDLSELAVAAESLENLGQVRPPIRNCMDSAGLNVHFLPDPFSSEDRL